MPPTPILPRTARSGTSTALTRQRLVGYVPDLIYAPELRYLAEVDERLEPAIRSSSITAQGRLIASGAGCGILPCFLGDATPGLVRLLRDEVAIERGFWLVVHRDMRRVARVEAFISWLRKTVADAQELLLGRAAHRSADLRLHLCLRAWCTRHGDAMMVSGGQRARA